jgi:hypothetical protein
MLLRAGSGWRIDLAPQATAVVRIEPGPRFRSAQVAPGDQVRLTVASPLELPQVIESTSDLVAWRPRLTNSPLESPYVIDLPWSSTAGAEFYRMRY